ncbi:MAG: hypothetical protein V4550_12510 [Gemmatimonadota bacterium]
MTQSRALARYAALIAGVVIASSCDTRLPTQASTSSVDDVEKPQVTLAVPAAINNSVTLGSPIAVTLTAKDNKGIASLLTTMRIGASVIGTDTASFKTPVLTTTRTIDVPLKSIKKGDVIVIRTTVTDAASNTITDSVTVNIATPSVQILTPLPSAKLNLGDSLLVTVRLTDPAGIRNLLILGYTLRGSAILGTQDTTIRYPVVGAPTATATFAAGVTDTTIFRYLKPLAPIDTLTDSLVVRAIARDFLGGVDTALVTIKMVRGPSVQLLAPVRGDSATAGTGLTIALRAQDLSGVTRLGFRLQSEPGFPTAIDTTVIQTYSELPKDVTFSVTLPIPINAPPRGVLTVTPISTNSGGQDGASAPTTVAIRAGTLPPPRVFQKIEKRVETVDSITITALGNGLRFVGYVLRDSLNNEIKRDSVALGTPQPSTAVVTIPLNLDISARGKKITLRSFAYDKDLRIGFSVAEGTTIPQTIFGNAFTDTALVVYGRTFPLPPNRDGIIADMQIDAARGNIFLSNLNYGRLEVWTTPTKNFDATGIIVGSQPWGIAFSRTAPNKDTMFVANSGGTNISRVFIGGPTASMKEDLDHRIVTRASYLFKFSENIDAATGKIRRTISPHLLFSDRPQHVEQSAAGRLYFSTRPTGQAPQGTIRYMQPTDSAPDERFILDFAFLGSDPNSWVLANLDDARVFPAPPGSTESDLLVLCDHPTGTKQDQVCFTSRELEALYGISPDTAGVVRDTASIQTIVALFKLQLPETDIEIANNIDFNSLGVTDTTYSAASGDGNWITFGEGNKAPVARNFLLQDDGTVAGRYTYASPSLNIVDLMTNQSDQIFGVALDKTGITLGVHGTETAFSRVDKPFTQRLQGKKSTFAQGAGIAFHPNANGVATPEASRLAFVASANGSIEAVDIGYYDFTRGSLATKFNLYGPVRATLPFPGDPANVVFKLFGLSPKGLVVIDVTASDVLKGP